MPKRYFKLCGREKYLVLSDPDAIDMLLSDFAWYEIPAWDYERRNRQFAHKVHITPPIIPDYVQKVIPPGMKVVPYGDGAGWISAPDNPDDGDFRNEGTDYFDIA